jgi:hypothetical protein
MSARVFNGLLSMALAGLIMLSGRSLAQDGPPIPDATVFMDLIRNTVLAVDTGNKTGDYNALHDMGNPQFQSRTTSGELAAQFAKLRALGLDLSVVKTMMPLTTRPPTLDRNGLLRILGYFEMPERRLIYDVVYTYDPAGKQWQLASILINPRELPPEPKLLQPE